MDLDSCSAISPNLANQSQGEGDSSEDTTVAQPLLCQDVSRSRSKAPPTSPRASTPGVPSSRHSYQASEAATEAARFSCIMSDPYVGTSSHPSATTGNSYVPPKPKESITAAMQKGVDENIYHWKVLNLSRAKLKASSRTSALLSGFAMVAMVEIQIDKVPEGLLITFAVCTVLLIAVHMLALMISTCILPNVEAVANLHFQTQKTVFESPHMTMNFIVELAWGFSTVLGILLFLLEIAILCWVKFYSMSKLTAWVATGLLIPIIFIFIAFAAHFYLKLVAHKSEVYEGDIRELETIQKRLEDEANHDANGAAGVHIV